MKIDRLEKRLTEIIEYALHCGEATVAVESIMELIKEELDNENSIN